MSKKDDELEDRLDALELERRIERGISAWVRTVCITATTGSFSFLVWLGSVTYDKLPAVKAAILAFIEADKTPK